MNLFSRKIYLILITLINIFFIFEANSESIVYKVKNQTPSYKIKKGSCLSWHKCSYDVMINSKYSEEELTIIANEIKELSPIVNRIFIVYYFPCMKIDSGGWATSHFLPDLSVDINDYMLKRFPKCAKFRKKNIKKIVKSKNTNKINVKMVVESEFENGKIYIKGKTNLPDYTDLYINVSKNGIEYFSNITTVQVGEFDATAYYYLKPKEKLPIGKYAIEIGTTSIKSMDESAEKILGSNGENMIGKLITKQASGNGKMVKFKSNYTVTSLFNGKRISRLLNEELDIFKNHYNKLKKICCGKSSMEALGIDWAVAGVTWTRKRQKSRGDFDKKFFKSSEKYTAPCSEVRLNIYSLGHDLFTLYQTMYAVSPRKLKNRKIWEKNIKEKIRNIEMGLKECRKSKK